MSTHTDIVVIGGGAAGMMAAIKALQEGCDVTVLEKNPFCGKKINITGKGRCNITNTRPWQEFSAHIHPNSQFFRSAFYGFSNQDTIELINAIGVPTVETQGKRIFPESMSARDVSRALQSYMEDLGAALLCDVDVIAVKRDGDSLVTTFCRTGGGLPEAVSSEAVIVATGGLSYPTTGSTGAGYDIARSFGHTITEHFPSLTALKPRRYDLDLQGIELENVGLVLFVDKSPVQVEEGDLSFTDNGIEGSIGYRVSRKAVWALSHGQRVELELDLKPALSLEKLDARISREIAAIGSSRATISTTKLRGLLRSFMPQALVKPFADSHPGLGADNLAAALKSWIFKIDSYTGYERCVVTAGGVSQKEIIAKTMCSKLDPGLYFAGEVLDLDGDTGGYNLQIAFSTGALAGRSAAQRILNSRLVSEEG